MSFQIVPPGDPPWSKWKNSAADMADEEALLVTQSIGVTFFEPNSRMKAIGDQSP